MSLDRIGPIAVDHRNPVITWSSTEVDGVRPCRVTGQAEQASVRQLSELVANPDRRITVGGFSGVLEYVALSGPVAEFAGWYLLDAIDVTAERPWTVANFGTSLLKPFSLSATYLGSNLEVVVARSARARGNAHGLVPVAVVADPFWTQHAEGEPFVPVPSGGSAFARSYDPTAHSTPTVSPAGGGRSLLMYAAAMASSVDTLPPVVVPAPRYTDADVPTWARDRGGDVRAYDRRSMREVFGPGHPFHRTTDVMITNGMIRFWIGNRGLIPFLNVQAFYDGSWREVGCLGLSAHADDVLRGVRVVRLTPEVATVVLTSRLSGNVAVTVRRGSRSIEVGHGSELPPYTSVERAVYWLGMPPAQAIVNVTSGTGKFLGGLTVDGYGIWTWPPDLANSGWAVAGRWLPSNSSATQANSGLLSILDVSGTPVEVFFTTADNKLNLRVGATTISTPALTFAAEEPVSWAVSLGPSGMILTVRIGLTTVQASNPSTSSGSAASTYSAFAIASVSGTPYGSGAYGDGPYGGLVTIPLNGVMDDLMIFDGPLLVPEAASLVAAAGPLDNLPDPEGRLIWYAPFDARAQPLGSQLAVGRRFEATTEGGATRHPDEWGMTKGLAALGAVGAISPFGISATGTRLDAVAFLATSAPGDDVADYHVQFAAASEQEVRVR